MYYDVLAQSLIKISESESESVIFFLPDYKISRENIEKQKSYVGLKSFATKSRSCCEASQPVHHSPIIITHKI